MDLLSYVAGIVQDFAAKNPALFLSIVYPISGAIVNLLIRYFTSDTWLLIVAKYPRLASLCKLMKALNIDLVGAVKWGFNVIVGKPLPPFGGEPPINPPTDPPAPPPAGPSETPTPVTRRSSSPLAITMVFLAMLGIASGATISACTSADRQVAVKGVFEITRGVCVLLRGFTSDGAISSVCATVDELSPIVKHIIAMRKYKLAHPGAAAYDAPLDACDFAHP